MQAQSATPRQTACLRPTRAEQLAPRQPVKHLAETLPGAVFEQAFGKDYREEGRPAKPVRRRVGLLLLKQRFNQGDETVAAAWVQNPCWQYFCGRHACQGPKAREAEGVGDPTVQEKNSAPPPDPKRAQQIIHRGWKLADRHGVQRRRRSRKAVRPGGRAQRWRREPKKRKAAHRALRKLQVITGRLMRERERQLPETVRDAQRGHFVLDRRVLRQHPPAGTRFTRCTSRRSIA